MRSALDMFTPRYADRLPPEAKRILATLSDNVVRLAFDAQLDVGDEVAELEPFPGMDEYWARRKLLTRARLRRDVPALNALSDEDLDTVIAESISAAIDPDLDPPPSQRGEYR
jgi:hypothetical protein